MERYSFDPISNTLTITANFAKKLQDIDSTEYALLKQLRSDFPGLTVRSRTHKTPTKYHAKSGEVFRCNQYKNLTYDNMERFICALPNRDELLPIFNYLKEEAAAVQTNGYTVVRRWFADQFPMYRKNPVYYLVNIVAPITELCRYLTEKPNTDEAA